MNMKSTVLLTLLMPGLALLSGCNQATPDADTPVDATTTAPTDMTPASTMPADTMPADTMATDSMATDTMPAGSASAPAMPSDGTGGMAGAADNLSFADMDKNSDGGIAHNELATGTMLDMHFSTADADSDGKLSEAEVAKHRADMAAAPAN